MEEINRIEKAIELANQYKSKLSQGVLDLQGFSGRKFRHFLNNIVDSNSRYLEIGVWMGSTFISALYNNSPEKATCIDNFTEFGGSKQKFTTNCNNHSITSYNLIDGDCFKADLTQQGFKYNTYFYDGHHDQIFQEMALTYFLPVLENQFIYIVDDWRHDKVQLGTRSGIAKCNLKILYEKEFNGMIDDAATWWNGMYVALLAKPV